MSTLFFSDLGREELKKVKKQNNFFHIRCSAELKAKTALLAKAQNLSPSKLIKSLILQEFNRFFPFNTPEDPDNPAG